LKIVFKCKEFVIINKPVGMPSQSDQSGDVDAMSATAELLTSMGERGELWLIHRLDRVVGGLLVFARTKNSAAELSKLVAGGNLNKHYFAVCEGRADGGEMRDFIFKDPSVSRAYISDRMRRGFKEAVLTYSTKAVNGEALLHSLVDIELKTGRFHQIRAQFSSRKMPLVGDKKYGSRDALVKYPALFAYRLGFTLFGKKYLFDASPELSEYPWCEFPAELYSEVSS